MFNACYHFIFVNREQCNENTQKKGEHWESVISRFASRQFSGNSPETLALKHVS